MIKKRFEVTIKRIVDVEVDETKFDAQFYNEFSQTFWRMRNLNGHMEHIACVSAGSDENFSLERFIEGYGPCKDMGITTMIVDDDMEVEEIPKGDYRNAQDE